MSTPNLIEVKATVGIDVSCYESVHLEIPEHLLHDEHKLSVYMAAAMKTMHEGEAFTAFEPDWETQSNFRLVCAARVPENMDSSEEREELILEDVPIEGNYHDFGLEVAGLIRRNEYTRIGLIDLAHHFKLID